jgi:L-rhamnose mutarotase
MLDLKEDPALIAEYERLHQEVWPEVLESIRASGIEEMEIYRWGNRLVMTMEVNAHFSFQQKAAMDQHNPKVQEWEDLMWKFQQALPGNPAGEKWQLMEKIFEIK